MMRHFSGLTVLLILAIVFLVGVVYSRAKPPQPEDQVADAAKQMYDSLGFEVEGAPSGGSGLAVLRVKSGSVADKLGIKAGDRFVAVNDRSIWHAQNMLTLLSDAMNQGPVGLMVARGDVYRVVVLGGGRYAGAAGGAPGAGGRRPGGRRMPAGAGRAPAPGGAAGAPGMPQPAGAGASPRGR